MKISFKNSSCKTICEIFVDDKFIGKVEMDVWTNKWSLQAGFRARAIQQKDLSSTYFSSYEAGKALADIYNKRFIRNKGDIGNFEFDLNELSLSDMLLFLKFET